MLFEYDSIKDLGTKNSLYKHPYFFIGAMMFLAGSVSLFLKIYNEDWTRYADLVVSIITPLGGLAFLIAAFKEANLRNKTPKYAIQISEEKIKAKHENDKESKDMFCKEINSLDFKTNEICITDKNNEKIIVDLSLIFPEQKKSELIKTLEGILSKNKNV